MTNLQQLVAAVDYSAAAACSAAAGAADAYSAGAAGAAAACSASMAAEGLPALAGYTFNNTSYYVKSVIRK